MRDPAQSLFFDFFDPAPEARILLLEGGDGWLAEKIADQVPNGEVLSLDRDIRQVEAAKFHLSRISNAQVSVDVLPVRKGWDAVLLTIPKERRFARSLLVATWQALKPGGQLLLAGPTRAGAKAAITDAERLFGNAFLLGYRKHQRVARCLRDDYLPDPLPMEFQQPGIAPGTKYSIEVSRLGGILTLETHPGIFSWQALDEGTALLLEHLQVESGSRVWDVGCGYGVIGLSTALAGAGQVTMSDVNLLAVKYSRQNVKRNGLSDKIDVFPADGLSPLSPPPPDLFDLIVSNPAFHQGREVDKSMADEMIAAAPRLLSPNGRLVVVTNHFLNYDKYMREHFQSVIKLVETSKFHVIEARN
jgi:16S rRNA (guanine1207-N2)-methyltransferase